MKERGVKLFGRFRVMIVTVFMIALACSLLPEMQAEAKTKHIYRSYLKTADGSTSSVKNKAYVYEGTMQAPRTEKLSVRGWVLSNLKVSSYTLYFSYGSDLNADASKLKYVKSMEAEVYDWKFTSKQNASIEGTDFIKTNSGWRADIESTGMRSGTWLVIVKGKLESDSTEFEVARFCINVEGETGKYASGNEVPKAKSLNPDKKYVSKIQMQEGFEAGRDEYFEVSGWALNDSGIKKYEYRVRDENNKKVKSGVLSAYNRYDLEEVSSVLGISHGDNQTNTGYSGKISIENLKPGTYKAYVYGYAYDGSYFKASTIQFTILPPAPKKITLSGKEKDHVITDGFCYLESDKFFLLIDKGADIPGDLEKNVKRIMKDLESKTGLRFNNGRKIDSFSWGTLVYGYEPWDGFDFGKKLPIFISVAGKLKYWCPNGCAEYVELNLSELVSEETWNEHMAGYVRSDRLYYVIAHELTHVLTDRYANMTMTMKEGCADFYAKLVVNDMNYKSFAGSKEYVNYNMSSQLKDKITTKSAEKLFRDDYKGRPGDDEMEPYIYGRMLCEVLMANYGESFLRDYLSDLEKAGYAYPTFRGDPSAAQRDEMTEILKNRFGSDVFKKFAAYYKSQPGNN
ncbi:MAG: hypothetical protein IK081_12745 [Lachnospiraceae bacterium]|nr:hypothetical protein [Lachnospiraceae bacterium]